MEKYCIHAYITGKVQGVFFRANTKKQAENFNITGWVRNLTDGRVEVFACGESAALLKFQCWLQQGPPGANVQDAVIDKVHWKNYLSFEVYDP